MRTIRLCKGKGTEGKSHCVMAATSIVAGERFSDHPSCVCPTIRGALIHVNDCCPSDEVRERLLGHLPWLIIGTRSEEMQVIVKRVKLFAEYAKDAVKAAAAAAAKAAYADADAAADAAAAAWEREMKKFIDFIEQKIIPVYTTMPIEPGYRIDQLVTAPEVSDE